MDVITPGFVGPFSKCTIGWKNGIHDLKRAPRHFFPSTHYASLPRQFCRLSFKHENTSEAQTCNIVLLKKKKIFALFLLS